VVGECQEVGVCLLVESISEIDVKNETANVSLTVGIFCSASADEQSSPSGKNKLDALWARMSFVGVVDMSKGDITQLRPEDYIPGTIGGEAEVTLKCKVDMDFASFPFDVQDVCIQLYCDPEVPTVLVSAEHFFRDGSQHGEACALATLPSTLVAEEWKLEAPIMYYGRTDSNETMLPFPAAIVHLKLVRKGAGYIKRFVSIISPLSLMALFPLQTPQLELADLFSFEVGLLFTMVAFQIIISGFLPVTSTLSILDWYTISLFTYVFVVMAVVTAKAAYHPDDTLLENMEGIPALLFAVWAAIHITFACCVYRSHVRMQVVLQTLPEQPKACFKINNPSKESGAVVARRKDKEE